MLISTFVVELFCLYTGSCTCQTSYIFALAKRSAFFVSRSGSIEYRRLFWSNCSHQGGSFVRSDQRYWYEKELQRKMEWLYHWRRFSLPDVILETFACVVILKSPVCRGAAKEPPGGRRFSTTLTRPLRVQSLFIYLFIYLFKPISALGLVPIHELFR